MHERSKEEIKNQKRTKEKKAFQIMVGRLGNHLKMIIAIRFLVFWLIFGGLYTIESEVEPLSSNYEDLDLEGQLRILNKPPIQSFQVCTVYQFFFFWEKKSICSKSPIWRYTHVLSNFRLILGFSWRKI